MPEFIFSVYMSVSLICISVSSVCMSGYLVRLSVTLVCLNDIFTVRDYL